MGVKRGRAMVGGKRGMVMMGRGRRVVVGKGGGLWVQKEGLWVGKWEG